MKNSSISNKERLVHILEAINLIEEFTNNLTKQSFLNDKVIQSAVLFQFSIIGEAIVQIDSGVLEKYDYPWHYVRSFRNFILHEYHAIEIWVVWETIIYNLPEIKHRVQNILKQEFN